MIMLSGSAIVTYSWVCVTSTVLQAFVVFGDAEEAQKACLKDREIFCEGDKFGDRYVRVYPTVESDLPDIQECLAAASSHGSEVWPHVCTKPKDGLCSAGLLTFPAQTVVCTVAA